MLMLLTLLPPANVASLACNACGPECANACGTAMFRACCFNYNRKRSVPIEEYDNTVTDIAANLSDGTEGISKDRVETFRKVNPRFRRRLIEKLLRFFGINPEEIRENALQQYHHRDLYLSK